ncbi:hypothetical protein HC928_21705 [bacterium]|nr:hypothetical protein [bacterium]
MRNGWQYGRLSAAFLQRYKDTEVLCASVRKSAAMHFGGITIECLLKAIVVASLPKNSQKEWKTDTHDPGHTITNPGHSLLGALKRQNRLYSRVQRFPEVMKWVNAIETPNRHFIDIRYSGDEPDDVNYKQWLAAYKSLKDWLVKQATKL